jgi:hypothetical protein
MFEKIGVGFLKIRLKNAEMSNANLMKANKKLKEENEKLKDRNKLQLSVINSLGETIEELIGEKNE